MPGPRSLWPAVGSNRPREIMSCRHKSPRKKKKRLNGMQSRWMRGMLGVGVTIPRIVMMFEIGMGDHDATRPLTSGSQI